MKRADVLFVPGVVVVVVGLAIGLSRPIGLRAQVQTSQRRPSFEVVSVKRNLSDERRNFSARPGGRLVVTNMTVKDLIAAAFGMADIQALIPERILGGPDWIDSERYNIDAKASAEFQFAPGGPPQEALVMLRSLLEERFKLIAHREAREMAIFELVVARKDGRLGTRRPSVQPFGAVRRRQNGSDGTVRFQHGVDAGPAADVGAAAWYSAGRPERSAARHSVAGTAWSQSRGRPGASGRARYRQRRASESGLRAAHNLRWHKCPGGIVSSCLARTGVTAMFSRSE